jgi:putative redox protein
MKAELVHVKGLTFTGKGDSGHWVSLDTIKDLGGNEGGTKPMEMLLLSLGGCTGMDVASILKKMQVQYDDFEISLEGFAVQEHPKVYEKIDLEYVFRGRDIDREKVEKAIRLSQERYCPVTAMLKNCVDINWKLEIIAPEDGD